MRLLGAFLRLLLAGALGAPPAPVRTGREERGGVGAGPPPPGGPAGPCVGTAFGEGVELPRGRRGAALGGAGCRAAPRSTCRRSGSALPRCRADSAPGSCPGKQRGPASPSARCRLCCTAQAWS